MGRGKMILGTIFHNMMRTWREFLAVGVMIWSAPLFADSELNIIKEPGPNDLTLVGTVTSPEILSDLISEFSQFSLDGQPSPWIELSPEAFQIDGPDELERKIQEICDQRMVPQGCELDTIFPPEPIHPTLDPGSGVMIRIRLPFN